MDVIEGWMHDAFMTALSVERLDSEELGRYYSFFALRWNGDPVTVKEKFLHGHATGQAVSWQGKVTDIRIVRMEELPSVAVSLLQEFKLNHFRRYQDLAARPEDRITDIVVTKLDGKLRLALLADGGEKDYMGAFIVPFGLALSGEETRTVTLSLPFITV